MNNRRLISALLIVTLTLLSLPIFGQNYDYARQTFQEMIRVYNTFIELMDKAATADEVAQAIHRFADGLESLEPRLIEMERRYPEFESMEEPPAALADVAEEMEDLSMEIFGAFMKMIEFAESSQVAEALQRLEMF